MGSSHLLLDSFSDGNVSAYLNSSGLFNDCFPPRGIKADSVASLQRGVCGGGNRSK